MTLWLPGQPGILDDTLLQGDMVILLVSVLSKLADMKALNVLTALAFIKFPCTPWLNVLFLTDPNGSNS